MHVWTCCCRCPPDPSAGDTMLGDSPTSKTPFWWGQRNIIQQQHVFLGQQWRVPFPCSIHGARKGSQLLSYRSSLDTSEGGISHHLPSTHRHTQEPLGHISEVSSTDQRVNSCAGCVPSRAPVVCTFWGWQRGLLPTISILIGIFDTTSNYCREQEQNSDFCSPRALMILSTRRNTQPCLRLQQPLHGVHLDLSHR